MSARRALVLDFSLIAPGGSATYACGFLDALSRRDDLDDVVVLIPDSDEGFSDTVARLVESGVRVRRLPLGTGWKSALARQLVVPYHSIRSKAGAVFCPRETGPLMTPARLVVLAGNLKAWSPTGSMTWIARVRWLARTAVARPCVARSTLVLAVSSTMASALPPRIRRTTVVVHHGCDFELAERSRLDAGDGVRTLRIVALGTVTPHKGVDRVIDAVATLRTLGQPADLEVWGSIGDRTYAERCSRVARARLGEDPLRGPADRFRLQQILAAADVLAMGSTVESFGLPLVEAMRTSCLVWAPASPLVDDLCGPVAVTYPERSSGEAATALIAALPSAAKLLSAGRERSLAFTWDSTVDRTLTLVRAAASSLSERRSTT